MRFFMKARYEPEAACCIPDGDSKERGVGPRFSGHHGSIV
jgi:hypothetical protein